MTQPTCCTEQDGDEPNKPVVQSRTEPHLLGSFASNRIWYPTLRPKGSPLSSLIRSATVIAEIRLGWRKIHPLQPKENLVFIKHRWV